MSLTLFRMWNESGAASGDFTRVAALVRSQFVTFKTCEYVVRSNWKLGSKLPCDAKDHIRGTNYLFSSLKVSIGKYETDKWRSWSWRTTCWQNCQYGQWGHCYASIGLLTRSAASARTLRAKLFKESYEFVRQQRLQCMMQGAWFMNGIPVAGSGGQRENGKRPARPWRFLRLVRESNDDYS